MNGEKERSLYAGSIWYAGTNECRRKKTAGIWGKRESNKRLQYADVYCAKARDNGYYIITVMLKKGNTAETIASMKDVSLETVKEIEKKILVAV